MAVGAPIRTVLRLGQVTLADIATESRTAVITIITTIPGMAINAVRR